VVELGLFDYPEDPIAEIRKSGNKVVAFRCHLNCPGTRRYSPGQHRDAGGDCRPPAVSADVLLSCVLKRFERKGEKLVELNRRLLKPAARRLAKRKLRWRNLVKYFPIRGKGCRLSPFLFVESDDDSTNYRRQGVGREAASGIQGAC
jgi:hypothetical protein